jgi:hypothetical protein
MEKFLAILVAIVMLAAVFTTVAIAKPKEPLDSVTFIHYKDGQVKSIDSNGKAAACYKLMGIQWKKFPIDYYVAPSVDINAIAAGNNEWDSHTSKQLFGTAISDSSANFDSSADGRNEYSYGDYPQNGVIAVTRTFYTRYTKEIVEYDVMFDSNFNWGDAKANPAVMDLQNIATHETGHGLGLSDIYNTGCSAVTMYGYSSNGDIEKRSLELSDILGLQKMYGP